MDFKPWCSDRIRIRPHFKNRVRIWTLYPDIIKIKEICYLIRSRHLIRLRAVAEKKKLFSYFPSYVHNTSELASNIRTRETLFQCSVINKHIGEGGGWQCRLWRSRSSPVAGGRTPRYRPRLTASVPQAGGGRLSTIKLPPQKITNQKTRVKRSV